MTGNVVFLGFAVADADDFSIPASLVAIAAFLAGALVGGRIGASAGHHRARLLAIATCLTTTVLTLTLTGLAADSTLAGGKGPHPGRRLLATATMFLGAAVGALLVFHVGIIAVLALALALLGFLHFDIRSMVLTTEEKSSSLPAADCRASSAALTCSAAAVAGIAVGRPIAVSRIKR